MSINLSSGYGCQVFAEIDSTNLEAKRQFRAGTVKPKWILARRQTAGYGRQNRNWIQAEGDFAASLLMPLDQDKHGAALPLMSFAVAIAVDKALIDAGVQARDLSLKWPNDVLLKGAKLCGILLELIEKDPHRALVVGVGVNMVTAPDLSAYATTRLADYLPPAQLPTPEQFLMFLDQRLMETTNELITEGFAPVRSAWLKRAHGIGSDIVVRLPAEELSGVFEGIDEDGALILRDGSVVHRINSGDVFFPV